MLVDTFSCFQTFMLVMLYARRAVTLKEVFKKSPISLVN